MSDTKHTPGPWHPAGYEVVADNDSLICNLSGWRGPGYTEANARLIAAAPELLEAPILMVRTHDYPADSLTDELREQQWLAQARAVITKATGE